MSTLARVTSREATVDSRRGASTLQGPHHLFKGGNRDCVEVRGFDRGEGDGVEVRGFDRGEGVGV